MTNEYQYFPDYDLLSSVGSAATQPYQLVMTRCVDQISAAAGVQVTSALVRYVTYWFYIRINKSSMSDIKMEL